MCVPSGVPSLTHGSSPASPSSALNIRRPATAAYAVPQPGPDGHRPVLRAVADPERPGLGGIVVRLEEHPLADRRQTPRAGVRPPMGDVLHEPGPAGGAVTRPQFAAGGGPTALEHDPVPDCGQLPDIGRTRQPPGPRGCAIARPEVAIADEEQARSHRRQLLRIPQVGGQDPVSPRDRPVRPPQSRLVALILELVTVGQHRRPQEEHVGADGGQLLDADLTATHAGGGLDASASPPGPVAGPERLVSGGEEDRVADRVSAAAVPTLRGPSRCPGPCVCRRWSHRWSTARCHGPRPRR